jgi:hypothetical protein
VVTVAAVYAGSLWLALWLAPVAALAAVSTLRTWDGGRAGQRTALVAAGSAGAITLASVAGPLAAIGVAVAAAILVAAPIAPRQARHPDDQAPAQDRVHGHARRGTAPALGRRVLTVVGPGAACAGAVLARNHGLDQGLVLIGMICAYDSAAYLIGTGANNPWEGPIAGVASIGGLTLLVAAVLFAPFRGNSPWILGGVAGVLAPLGPVVGRRLTPTREVRLPALRRLDSLLLLGPAWAIGVAVLLHH